MIGAGVLVRIIGWLYVILGVAFLAPVFGGLLGMMILFAILRALGFGPLMDVASHWSFFFYNAGACLLIGYLFLDAKRLGRELALLYNTVWVIAAVFAALYLFHEIRSFGLLCLAGIAFLAVGGILLCLRADLKAVMRN